jgi:hypothetical protein
MTDFKAILQQASPGSSVRVFRSGVEDGWADGYLVQTGPEFFAIHVVDKGIRLDGFNCLRYSDITSAELPAPCATFIDRVLKLRGQRVADSFPFDMTSIETLICDASRVYSVVTLHLESLDPDTCYIGRVLSVRDGKVSMQPISTEGEWLDDEDSYALPDISRVDFGGAYEEALVLAAGRG